MRILLVLILSVWIGGSATAQTETEGSAVRSVIEQQLQAFLRDDGATAYSFAAPSIKRLFPTQDIFMDMVRNGYQPVYRPRAYEFGELNPAGGGVEQFVDIIDANGEYWTARYTLELVDGMWRITSCSLEKRPGVGV